MSSSKLLGAALLTALVAAACSADQGTPDSGRRDGQVGDVRTDGTIGMDARGDTGSGGDADPGDTSGDNGIPIDTGVGRDSGGLDDTGTGTDVPIVPVDVTRDTGLCTPGAISCATIDQRRTCQLDGTYVQADCPTGQLCVDGVGCTVCEPGAVRCSADGVTLETCAPDAMRWVAGTRCDTAMGQVCEGYRCVNACARAASQRSYLGCEYWPTTMANSQLYNVFQFAVSIANPQTYQVIATITGGALGAARRVTIAPGAVVTEILPWVPALAQLSPRSALVSPPNTPANSVLARGGAYRLVTTAPVAVYQFSPLTFSSGGNNSYTNDASLLLPTHVLTGDYMALTRNTWSNFGGELAVVGTDAAPTNVMVRLRGGIRAGTGVAAAASGATVTYTLNRGDVLQLMGSGNSGGTSCTSDDLTGSVVTADHPVAVFVGHDCTFIPCSTGYCDHLEEQLFPNQTWGRRYVVSGLRERGPGETAVVRVLSQTAGNNLTFDGIARPAACPATLNAGQFCEFEAVPDFAVNGTQPMLIAQFMVGQDRVSGVGDPAMVLEVPTQQFRTSYVFNVPGSYTNNFLTVVYPTGVLPNIDGRAIAAGTAAGGSGFSVTRFSVAAGSHTMTGAGAFGIKVSGTASYTSYMYPGGLDLNQLAAP